MAKLKDAVTFILAFSFGLTLSQMIGAKNSLKKVQQEAVDKGYAVYTVKTNTNSQSVNWQWK